MILIEVDGDVREAAAALEQFDEVDYLVLTAGSVDILAEVFVPDDAALLSLLNDRIRKVPGVARTESVIYLQLTKQTHSGNVPDPSSPTRRGPNIAAATSTEGATEGTTVDADLAELASAIDLPAWPRPGPGAGPGARIRRGRRARRRPASDVDEWGRSERMRAWRGASTTRCTAGGSAPSGRASRRSPPRAAPCWSPTMPAPSSGRPVIMHGIEEELKRPVYGLADNLFRTIPVVGTLWSRVGGSRTPTTPTGCCRSRASWCSTSRRREGPGQDDQRALPAAPLRPGRVRRDRHAGRGPGHPHRRRRGRGVHADPGPDPVPAVAGRRPLRPAHRQHGADGTRWPGRLPAGQVQAAGPRPGALRRAADQERYCARVMDESEAIRDRIQSALYDMLRRRRSVWFR